MKQNKSILKFQIFSTILIMILGTLLHFTFEWSGKNPIIGSFSAVNESTWEHLKLLFFPILLTTFIGYFYIGKEYSNFLCSKALSIFISISFITIFFYTYTGIIGTNYAILDIGSFFIAVLLGEYICYKNLTSGSLCNNWVPIIFFIILFIFFIVFTYFTPQIGYFKDPITNLYGIEPF